MNSVRLRVLVVFFIWQVLALGLSPKIQAADSFILQGLVGAGAFDSDSLTFRLSPEEPGEEEDLSTMPMIGFAGQHLLSGNRSRLGVEWGILLGWRSRSSSAVIGSQQVRIKIDSSLWLLDLSAGACFQQRLGSRWRLYLAAGPAMLFGEYDADEDIEEEGTDPAVAEDLSGGSESEFGVGGYARIGVEYEIAPTALVGFSVRGLATNLEFDNTVDATRLNGVQAFVTFTRNFGGSPDSRRRFGSAAAAGRW